MNLTRFTDYSLRILIFLAIQPEPRLSNIQEISALYRISNNHLMKAVHELGKLGLIQTVRGRNGGIRLAQAPEAINIGYVVRQTEENWHVVECFDEENGFCVISPLCRLKGVLQEALAAYLQVLDRYTLADLAANRRGLSDLLLPNEPRPTDA